MGGSQWTYVVQYDENVERAFRKLRSDVFARKEFYSSEPDGNFESIEELREAQAEEGTHSILDMMRVSTSPAPPKPTAEELGARLLATLSGKPDLAYGTIYRMTDEELVASSGSTRPQEPPNPRALRIERGTGRYTTLFKGETPVSLWFGGFSGD